jgi:nucleotide-binding universal stress UspA family protein
MDIKRIVVPTDFSVQANAALRYATELAKAVGAGISLVHVAENPVEGSAWAGKLHSLAVDAQPLTGTWDAERQLKMLVDGLPAEFATGSWVRTGSVGAAIITFAVDVDADLIVMGTTGRTGLGHMVIGSVAEHMVRHAPCPVLTIGAHAVQHVGAGTPVAVPARDAHAR